jgi:hypothetical protein
LDVFNSSFDPVTINIRDLAQNTPTTIKKKVTEKIPLQMIFSGIIFATEGSFCVKFMAGK